ncbi:oxidoreductase [Streptomyces fumigatiscleroticus]|nr:oxidoreductase [Streptomyces fumigatiscleroticus]
MASRRGGVRGLLRDVARGREIDGARLAAYLRRAASRAGHVRIEGARCRGPVDLRKARLEAHLELVDCHFHDELLLADAVVDSLDLTGSRLAALHADGVRVGGDLVLRGTRIGPVPAAPVPLSDPGTDGDRVTVPRRVPEDAAGAPLGLVAARIDGGLVLERAELGGTGTWALFAPRVTVGDSLRAGGLRSRGALYLRDARISHSLLLDRASVGAVDATGLRCDGGFYADWGFSCAGPVRLRGAEVGRVVTFHDALLAPPAGAAVLTRLRTPRLRVDFRARPAGALVLRDARIGSYVDSPAGWPAPGALDVEGLTYDRLGSTAPVGVRERLAWLARDAGAGAGSFEQLALSYQRAGDERSARLVRHARERRMRRSERLPGRVWGAVQNVLFGYGYAPGRALAWLLALVAAGSAWFAAHPPAPAGGGPRRSWDPVLYTLDLIVPVAGLGQRTAWDPAGAGRAVAVLLILAGWLLATAVVAGASRALSRT